MAKVEKTIKTNEDGTFDVEIMIGGGPGLVDVSVQAGVQGGGSASVATAKAYVPAPGGSGGSSPTATTTTTATTTPSVPGISIEVVDSLMSYSWVVYYVNTQGNPQGTSSSGEILVKSDTEVSILNTGEVSFIVTTNGGSYRVPPRGALPLFPPRSIGHIDIGLPL